MSATAKRHPGASAVPMRVPRRLAVRCRLAVATMAGALAVAGGGARAATVDPARVRVAAALMDEVVRGLLPFDVVLPGAPGGAPDGGSGQTPLVAVVTELRYCGATEKGAGRFRAVVRWGMGGRASGLALAGDEACRLGLGELVKSLPSASGPDDGVAVADLEAVWRPWELRLGVVRTALPSPPKGGPPRPLAALEGRRELLLVSTAGLKVATDAGETLTFHLAPSFAADGVELAAVFGENGAGPSATRPPSASGPGTPLSLASGNTSGELPFSFANQVLRQLTGNQPFAIPVDRDVIDVQNVSLAAGVGGGVTVVGTATPRSLRETARVTVQAGGAELRVLSVRADAQLENCAASGVLAAFACNTRNAGRQAAAAAFGAALTRKYQGQQVRELAGPQVYRFDLGARRLELRGDLLHLGGGGRGLFVGARFNPGEGSVSSP